MSSWRASCAISVQRCCRFVSGLVLLVELLPASSGLGQDRESLKAKDVDLFGMHLLADDLDDAAAAIRRHDVNRDGVLAEKELESLSWPSQPLDFDLNRDKRLSELEAAVQFAFHRYKYEVAKVDLAGAERQMSQYDRNRDQELNATEIRLAGWPEEPEEVDLDGNSVLTVFELAARNSAARRERLRLGILGLDQGNANRFTATYDLDKDRYLDAEEFRTAASTQLTREIDTDGDGKASILELAARFAAKRKEAGITKLDQQAAVKVIRRFDDDRDGELSAEEFNPAVIENLPAEARAQVPKLSALVDLDKNGRISRLEVAANLAKERKERGVSSKDQVDAARLIARYDRNGNQRIDSNEVGEGAPRAADGDLEVDLETFIEYDADSDFMLTAAELAAFCAAHRTSE